MVGNSTPNELRSLADAVCMETVSDHEIDALVALLEGDRNAQQFYLDYCRLHTELLFSFRGQQAHQAALNAIRSQTAPPPAFGFLGTALHGTIGYFSDGMPLAYLLATVIFGVGLLISSRIYVSGPEQVAHQSVPLPSPLSPLPSPSQFVGRITGMDDCHWADPQTEVFNGANVPLGRKYALRSGLMEITYYTGARVILQGPVNYGVDSKNGGFLAFGKLTGKVTTEAARGLAIRMPTATVTDLGTEFGVEVSDQGAAKVCVLVGAVRVENHLCGSSQVGHAGEAFEVDAHATRSVEASEIRKQFVRTMPTRAFSDSTRGSFRDNFEGKPSRHWINPNAAICRDGRITFVDLAYLRTAGDFNYATRDFIATVKMTNGDKGAQSSAFLGLGDGTFGTFYEEPCADGVPSVYFMYPGPGWTNNIAAVHTTQAEGTTGVNRRKCRNIPATESQPAGTTITVELGWTVATDTAVFRIDMNNDGVYEHRFSATYPGLSSSEHVGRLFIGGANGVSFSDFNVTVGPHEQAPANIRCDDESPPPQQ